MNYLTLIKAEEEEQPHYDGERGREMEAGRRAIPNHKVMPQTSNRRNCFRVRWAGGGGRSWGSRGVVDGGSVKLGSGRFQFDKVNMNATGECLGLIIQQSGLKLRLLL